MEISPYYSSVESDKYLKQIEEQIKLLASHYEVLQTSVSDIEAIEALKEIENETRQIFDSKLYRSVLQIDSDRNDAYSQTISDQLSSIEMLGKFQELKNLSIESLESNGVYDYGRSNDLYNIATRDLLALNDFNGETIRKINDMDLDQIIKSQELRDKIAKKAYAERMKKYANDYKFMLKVFTPGSTMYQATEILADAYMKIFQSLI